MGFPNPFRPLLDSISTRVAFFPPSPPSYVVMGHDDNRNQLYIQPRDRWAHKPLCVGAQLTASTCPAQR